MFICTLEMVLKMILVVLLILALTNDSKANESQSDINHHIWSNESHIMKQNSTIYSELMKNPNSTTRLPLCTRVQEECAVCVDGSTSN